MCRLVLDGDMLVPHLSPHGDDLGEPFDRVVPLHNSCRHDGDILCDQSCIEAIVLGQNAAGASAGSAIWPFSAPAQQAKVARIGFLGLVSPSSHAPRVAALRAGLRDLGWIEGREILIEFRWGDGNNEQLPAMAEELVGLNVDVLVTHGAAGALAAKNATSTIPIVITAAGDMVALGLISSLS